MRNLPEYPVTRQEILSFLEAQRCERDPELTGLIGDISPILLDHIIAIVQAAFELDDGIQRRMNERGMGFVVPFREATKLMQATDLDSI